MKTATVILVIAAVAVSGWFWFRSLRAQRVRRDAFQRGGAADIIGRRPGLLTLVK